MAQANPSKLENEFDKDFEPADRLFHYTSSEGLYGILGSNCLWATHFKFLNDSNEFYAARKSLTQFVEVEIRKKIAALKVSGKISLKGGVSLRELSDHEAGVIVNSMYEATLNGAQPFIFSFFVTDSTASDYRNGQLLHWATYGRGGGYALEMNPHKIAKLLEGRTENLLCQKAIYVKGGVPEILKDDYETIGKVSQEMIEALLNDNLNNLDVSKSAASFMRIASVIKDAFFEGEKEARLVSLRLKAPGEKYIPPQIFVRHSDHRAMPYIKFFEGRLLGDQCPIESITIGPHPDRERRREALLLFLQANGLERIGVFESEVPYLGG